MKAGRFFTPLEESVQCSLCPRRCRISPGKAGSCEVRFNRGGKGEIPFYGYVTALVVDPIEKKPLYHFRPGSGIYSAGFNGCNLHCPFCQNWRISQNTDVPGDIYRAEDLIAKARQSSASGQAAIAYTYSEPLVHIEFLLDCMKEARKAGIANVLVSNGCVNTEAAEEVLDLCDAANIDLKCFSAETYNKILGGDLSAVTGFIRMAAEKKVHLELTTLLVPGLNDSKAELDKCADFIAELQSGRNSPEEGGAVPWHLSAYHPDYKWKAPATAQQSLVNSVKRAREKLAFVYAGNIAAPAGERNFSDTICTYCGKTLVGRLGYRIDTSGLSKKTKNGKPACFCVSCRNRAPIAL